MQWIAEMVGSTVTIDRAERGTSALVLARS